MTTPQSETLIIGRVIAPHGVRGEMKIEPLTHDARRFASLQQVTIDGREHRVESFRDLPPSGVVLLRLSGITTPEEVRSLRGRYLRIPFEQAAPLPEGEYYHHQLEGLRVETTGAQPLGEIVEVLPLEANDVYVVRGERGEVLIPATREVVREIDLPAGRVIVEPVPGLLPWEDERG